MLRASAIAIALGLAAAQAEEEPRQIPGRKVLTTKQPHVNSLTFAPNGKWFVTGGADNTLRMWTLKTGAHLRVRMKGPVMKGQKEEFPGVNDVVVTRDGRWIVSAADGIRVWGSGSGATARRFASRKDARCLALMDGTAVVTGDLRGRIRVWDLNTGKVRRTIAEDAGALTAIALVRGGELLVSTDQRGTVKIWDAKTGKMMRSVQADSEYLRGILVQDDGKRFFTYGGPTVRVWKAVDGTPVRAIQVFEDGDVFSIAVSPDGKHLVTTGLDRGTKDAFGARVWEIETRKLAAKLTAGDHVSAIAVTPAGRWILGTEFTELIAWPSPWNKKAPNK